MKYASWVGYWLTIPQVSVTLLDNLSSRRTWLICKSVPDWSSNFCFLSKDRRNEWSGRHCSRRDHLLIPQALVLVFSCWLPNRRRFLQKEDFCKRLPYSRKVSSSSFWQPKWRKLYTIKCFLNCANGNTHLSISEPSICLILNYAPQTRHQGNKHLLLFGSCHWDNEESEK